MTARVLTYHIGHLGDTIVAMPAFRAVRDAFPKARHVLLTRVGRESHFVPANAVLDGSGLFDDIIVYRADDQGNPSWSDRRRYLGLLLRLRAARFDTLAYLMPSARSPASVVRDRAFFRLAGIKRIVGMDHIAEHARDRPRAGIELPHEAEEQLSRLRASGIDTPRLADARLDLGLTAIEREAVQSRIESLPDDGRRPWVGIGPGSKMPAKRWPRERFVALGERLVRRFDIWPVIFGGAEDAEQGDALIDAWGRGYNFAGPLSPREASAALALCQIYVGNDTGTMHLAAAEGTPCVAIFSARDWPGRWDPIGADNRVLRSDIDCQCCELEVCSARHNECLTRITVDAVVDALSGVLERL